MKEWCFIYERGYMTLVADYFLHFSFFEVYCGSQRETMKKLAVVNFHLK